jgi:hypothetical protein
MEAREYADSEQVLPSVALGLVPPPLPEILFLRRFVETVRTPPPEIIKGVLHRGCKLMLGGTSKSNKSWSLLDLAVSVAAGQPWWGIETFQGPVIYINFELHDWAMGQRLNAILAARPECGKIGDTLAIWNLRGRNCDLSILRPQLEEQLMKHGFVLIIVDPVYKVLGDRDENSNGDIAGLMNEFEALAASVNASLVGGHHFAKGDSTTKNAIDRMSGAGAWARDPDALVILTPHETENCFTVTSILRNVSPKPEFVVEWQFPLMRVTDLDPSQLRTPQAGNKRVTDSVFITECITETDRSNKTIISIAKNKWDMADSTAENYLRRLSRANLIHKPKHGVYRLKP